MAIHWEDDKPAVMAALADLQARMDVREVEAVELREKALILEETAAALAVTAVELEEVAVETKRLHDLLVRLAPDKKGRRWS